MPENVTPERKRILRAYGAEMVFTDPLKGPTARFARCEPSQRRIRSLLVPGPGQQRGQPRRALRHDRPGDPRADGRAGDALRRRPWHERHFHGRRRFFRDELTLASSSSRCSPILRCMVSRGSSTWSRRSSRASTIRGSPIWTCAWPPRMPTDHSPSRGGRGPARGNLQRRGGRGWPANQPGRLNAPSS